MTLVLRLIRRPIAIGAIFGVLGLLLAWWFVWMAPEGQKLVSVRMQESTDQMARDSLVATLAQLKLESKQSSSERSFITRFVADIPPEQDAPSLVVLVYRLAVRDGVKLQSITDNTVSPSSSELSTVPVTMAVSGAHDAIVQFVSGLYRLPRLLTIQSLALAGSGNVNAKSATTYTATISATAYTTYVATSVKPVG